MVRRAPDRRKEQFRRQVHGSATDDQLRALVQGAEVAIDARGTFCPEPVIRIQHAARQMQVGQAAMLLADDAGVEVDVPAWCMSTGNEYLGLLREPAFLRVFIRRG
ncbi:MAG TPA: sulfurtransferase TusA family protein [Acidobacteriota bacterium]|nr:sulfurtransferase TusA family protein [Acidobacteriota bacterium]